MPEHVMMLQPVTSAEASSQRAIMVDKLHGTMPTTISTGLLNELKDIKG